MKQYLWIVCATVLFFGHASSGQTSEEYQIDNQRIVEVETANWTNLYVGKYTSGNGLVVSNNNSLTTGHTYIGYTDTASTNYAVITGDWKTDQLTIGTDGNTSNLVAVVDKGVLELNSKLNVQGVGNGNGLIIADGGTLSLTADFSAEHQGLFYAEGGVLKTTATISDLEILEGERGLILSGGNAAWNRTNSATSIGLFSDNNTLELTDEADIDFQDLFIGHGSTSSNYFTIESDSKSTVSGSLILQGTDNNLIIDSGTLNASGILASEGAIKLSDEGELNATGQVMAKEIQGEGTVNLTGENAQWDNSGQVLTLGTTTAGTDIVLANKATLETDAVVLGTESQILIGNDSKVTLLGDGSFIGGDSSIKVDDGGWLTFGSASAFSNTISFATDATLVWQSGGTVEFKGEAPVYGSWASTLFDSEDNTTGHIIEHGALFLNSGRTMIISGPNGSWAANTNNLHIGDLSSENTLIIADGASANVNSLSIGDFKENGNDNQVIVRGNGTLFDSATYTAVGGTLIDGKWHKGGRNNLLHIDDGANFRTTTLYNKNSTSGIKIGPNAILEADEYYQGAGAYLTILTDTTGMNTGLLLADKAEFETNARVGVDAASKLQLDTTYTNTIVSADLFIIGGVTNATTDDLHKLGTSGGSLVYYDLMLEDGTNLVATYNRRFISDSAGFDPDSILTAIGDEIDRISTNANEEAQAIAANQVDILANLSSEDQKLQMEQTYIYQLPSFMHGQSVLGGIDQVRARGAGFRGMNADMTSDSPKGAAGPGPHAGDQDFQLWVKAYGGFGNRDAGSDYNDGYDVQGYGTVLGADQAFGQWLFGIAGGYAGSSLESDNGDKSDAGTGYGVLYSSYGTNEWFADLVLGYGMSDIENSSGSDFDITSDTKASHMAAYFGIGKEYVSEDSDALLRPLLAVQVSNYDQDAYTEESDNALAKDVEAYDRWSYQSILGASMIVPISGKKLLWETDWRAFWIHEFNDDEENVGYTLVDSSVPGQFVMRSPDSDIAQLGLGLVAKSEKGHWQFRVDIDGQISKTYYSTTLSAAALYEF